MNSCVVCQNPQVDKAHIKSKGAGGSNEEDNIFFLCRSHHQEQHRIGHPAFWTKYYNVRMALFEKGWTVQVVLGQRRLVRVEP